MNGRRIWCIHPPSEGLLTQTINAHADCPTLPEFLSRRSALCKSHCDAILRCDYCELTYHFAQIFLLFSFFFCPSSPTIWEAGRIVFAQPGRGPLLMAEERRMPHARTRWKFNEFKHKYKKVKKTNVAVQLDLAKDMFCSAGVASNEPVATRCTIFN